jgi:hypothetical protein
MRVKITGIKGFEGDVNGSKIDSGKIFAECKLDGRNNSERQFGFGVFTEEFKLPSAEMARRIKHIPLPFFAELHLERVGNGRESREIVVDVVPINNTPAQQAAPAATK